MSQNVLNVSLVDDLPINHQSLGGGGCIAQRLSSCSCFSPSFPGFDVVEINRWHWSEESGQMSIEPIKYQLASITNNNKFLQQTVSDIV